MNTYEFWNDMDKIYDAIVAYQEKTIEFNKQFINPWVKLGNIFDKNETNEEIIAHKNAIEIDPKNAQNWYQLAKIYTRSGDFEKSIQAFQKTIELGFESGELYKNLALAYAMTAKHQDSILFFQKALEMLKTNKEKATVWDHLGNVYRKLDNYEMALQAFQQADQFEAGKVPNVDELPATTSHKEFKEELALKEMVVEEGSASQSTGQPAAVPNVNPTTKDATLAEGDEVFIHDSGLVEPIAKEEEVDSGPVMLDASDIELPFAEDDKAAEENDDSDNDMQVVLEVDFSSGAINEEAEATLFEEETVAEITSTPEEDVPASLKTAQEGSKSEEVVSEEEPSAEFPTMAEEDVRDDPVAEFLAATEEDKEPISKESVDEEHNAFEATVEDEPVAEVGEVSASGETVQEETEETATEEVSVADMAALEENDVPVSVEAKSEETATEEKPIAEFLAILQETAEAVPEAEEATIVEKPATDFLAGSDDDEAPVSVKAVQEETEEPASEDEPAPEVVAESEESVEAIELGEGVETLHESDATPALSAYEEYLKDNDPVGVNLAENASNEVQTITMASADVAVTNSEVNMEVSADMTIEMDSKNAHVWNELGNVYFNAGSYDDAIAAYNKAIELDTQFAWPYTNLALSYVQKERLADAIYLYQRGIELFSNEKDKAVAWNRLGNVYRRMNDYENAITAYQRADELDPGNTAVPQQPRFSLLGSEKIEQEAEYSV